MKKLVLLTLLLLMVPGCGPNSGLTTVGGGGSSTETGAGTTPTTPALEADLLKSTVDSGPNQGALALDLDIAGGFLILRIPMASSLLVQLPIVSGQIAQIPGASFQTLVDANGRNAIVIKIPVEQYLKGLAIGTPGRLPNGDVLPAITRGELPTVALIIDLKKNIKLHLYLGSDQVAAFVETPNFNPFTAIPGLPVTINQLIFPVKDKRKQVLGYFGYIGSKLNYSGGFYLATNLPPAIVRLLDDYFIN
ncbi:MAG: hypothetical protein V4736_04510 [Bdellovibrionota bacterium]